MKANEVKNFGQLEQFLNEEAKGLVVRGNAWNGFFELRIIMNQVDKAFDVKTIRGMNGNYQSRYLYYGDLYVGYISYKKTSDSKIKEVTLSVRSKGESWLDVVSANEKRKNDEEIKATELLEERGFKSLDDLVAYLRKFPDSKRKEIRSHITY